MQLKESQLKKLIRESIFDSLSSFFFGSKKEGEQEQEPAIRQVPSINLPRKRNISIPEAEALLGDKITEKNSIRSIASIGSVEGRDIYLVIDVLGSKRIWYMSASEKVPVEIEGFSISPRYNKFWFIKSHWDKRPYAGTLEDLIYINLEAWFSGKTYTSELGFEVVSADVNIYERSNLNDPIQILDKANELNASLAKTGFDASLAIHHSNNMKSAYSEGNLNKVKELHNDFTDNKLGYSELRTSNYDTSMYK